MKVKRNLLKKATDTSKKNRKLYDELNALYNSILKKYDKDKIWLWREVEKRKYLNIPKFKDDIEKGEKVLPDDMVKMLDEKLPSKRKKTMFFKIVDKYLKIRRFKSIDKIMKKAS